MRVMRFSIGASLGPPRASQSLGLPRSNSRPGYLSQFETCTINHRSSDAERRCGHRHPPSAAEQAAAAQTSAEARARIKVRKAAQARYRAGARGADTCQIVADHHANEAVACFVLGMWPGVFAAALLWVGADWWRFPAYLALVCAVGMVWHIVAALRVPTEANR